jgi:hypothetical protein
MRAPKRANDPFNLGLAENSIDDIDDDIVPNLQLPPPNADPKPSVLDFSALSRTKPSGTPSDSITIGGASRSSRPRLLSAISANLPPPQTGRQLSIAPLSRLLSASESDDSSKRPAPLATKKQPAKKKPESDGEVTTDKTMVSSFDSSDERKRVPRPRIEPVKRFSIEAAVSDAFDRSAVNFHRRFRTEFQLLMTHPALHFFSDQILLLAPELTAMVKSELDEPIHPAEIQSVACVNAIDSVLHETIDYTIQKLGELESRAESTATQSFFSANFGDLKHPVVAM